MTDRIADIFFSAYWKFKWNGDDLKRRAHAMAVFERLSLDEQRRIQLDRLRALVDHARKEVPHCATTFAQAGIASGADLKTLDDLALLPVTRRSDVQAHGASMAARQGFQGEARANATGGSTGAPVSFLQDDEYWNHARATELRVKEWWGIKPWDKTAALWGADRDIPEMTVKERVYLKLQREFFLNSFQMDVPRMHAFVRTLRHERPRYIKGYAGSLATFARFLDANAIDVPPAVAIRSSAEVLRPQDRALIEKRFQAPVYDFYGSREVNNLAAECERRSGLHVLAWGRIVELVDRAGRPVPEGQPGRVLVTDLTNRAMPFFRYENGDMATWATGTCACGRTLPRLARIEGRQSDFLIASDGTLIHGEFFTHLFYGEAGVEKFQVEQTARHAIVVRIVGTESFIADRSADITRKMQAKVGGEVQIEWQRVAEIPETATGKRRFTLRSFPWES